VDGKALLCLVTFIDLNFGDRSCDLLYDQQLPTQDVEIANMKISVGEDTSITGVAGSAVTLVTRRLCRRRAFRHGNA
jgi:hypothetical protein